jgi:hypothetical protein
MVAAEALPLHLPQREREEERERETGGSVTRGER